MYKNQLQELAQRSCFNLPAYACVREGPDHAPRFKASVNFNGEIFQGPSQCTTLRQAEHAAAEVALANLSSRARSLAARVLDETGVYKNLLQETTHRAGLKLPIYTTVRSGPGHQPVFTSTVELAGMCIAGESAKTKKQAEKNAAMAAWSALKQMPDLETFPRPVDDGESGGGGGGGEEQEQLVRYLSSFKPKEDNKQSKQRQHYQQQLQNQRKKIVHSFNEGISSSSSPHRSLRFQHQWRSLESLPDFSFAHPSQQQHKNYSFLAPALSARPKVPPSMLFTLNSPASSQDQPFSSKKELNYSLFQPNSRPIPSLAAKSLSQARSQELPTLMKAKNIERVNEISSDQSKPSRSSVLSHRFTDPNLSVLSPPRLSVPLEAVQLRNSSSISVPRIFSAGVFHCRGIAPAVQIRSVIPVCAAPPVRQPQPAGGGPSVEISDKETGDKVSAATSKINKLQL